MEITVLETAEDVAAAAASEIASTLADGARTERQPSRDLSVGQGLGHDQLARCDEILVESGINT